MARVHLLVDWWTENLNLLSHPQPMVEYLDVAAQTGGYTVVGKAIHKFEPVGYTAVLLLSESHLAVHSWVEESLLTIDIFTCNEQGVTPILNYLKEQVCPVSEKIIRVHRGEMLD